MSAFREKGLPFIKSYGLLIGLGLIAIVGLPTAFYFAQGMNAAFTEQLQTEVNNDYKAVTQADQQYSVLGPGGEKVLEKKGPLNAETIKAYAEGSKIISARLGEVWKQGLNFNKADHSLLIQGVFPAPPDLERDVKIRELVGAVIQFHAQLLAKSKAGAAPDAAILAEQIKEHRNAYLERLKAQRGNADLDNAEKEKLTKELVDVRIDRCRRRAMELNVYVDPGVFVGIPTEVPTKAPTLAEAWDLQEHSWIDSDLMRAIAAANQSSQTGVIDAIVKRIFSITVHPPAYDPANPTPQGFEAGEEKVPLDPMRTLTGRIAGPGSKNKWYDLRHVDIDIIVVSQRLPELIDALAATNFMTVLEVDLSAVSPRDDLRAGYYYGDAHVVRARLSIEFVLLREWRTEWMPAEVKAALGMDDKVQGTEGGGAPPPRPSGGGAGGGKGPGGKRPN